MSLTVDGFWKAGFWSTTFWADGFWFEGTPPVEIVAEQPRGRAAWLADLPRRERRPDEISRARERFGIIDEVAAQAIAEVAARQAERNEQDEQKRFEELHRELELRRIEWDARYLEMLGVLREQYIEEERGRIAIQQREEEEIMVLLMMVASIA